MEKVYFIGAGPGDPELITVKGQRIIKEADVIIYAGSLVPREVIDCHKAGAEIYNSAVLNLEEVMDIMISAVKNNKKNCKSSYRRPCNIWSSQRTDGYFRSARNRL